MTSEEWAPAGYDRAIRNPLATRHSVLVIHLLVVLAALVCIPTSAAAQGLFDVPHPTEVAAWSVRAEPEAATPGSVAALVLSVDLDGDWRMYALGTAAGKPLAVAFDSTLYLVPSVDVTQDSVELGFDPNFDTDVTYFTESSRLRVPLAVAEHASPGRYVLPGTIEYMLCNDRVCLPPTTVSVEGVVVVGK